MPQDQLTRCERLRLEAFAQACNSSFTIKTERGERPTIEDLFAQAKRIEQFLYDANPKMN